jgi:hypothetical protein
VHAGFAITRLDVEEAEKDAGPVRGNRRTFEEPTMRYIRGFVTARAAAALGEAARRGGRPDANIT